MHASTRGEWPVLKVQYIIEELPDGRALDIEEDRGRVVFRIAPDLTPEQIASVLTEGATRVLAGGHWFQEWKGDIITADPAQGGAAHRIPPQRLIRHDDPQPKSDAA
jgi:hypothetical protein